MAECNNQPAKLLESPPLAPSAACVDVTPHWSRADGAAVRPFPGAGLPPRPFRLGLFRRISPQTYFIREASPASPDGTFARTCSSRLQLWSCR